MAFMMDAEEQRQAEEILMSNGRCPKDTMCCDCIMGVLGEVKYCNPSYAISLCQEFLGIEGGE